MRRRRVLLGVLAGGAVWLAIGGAPLGAPVVSALGWALAAGVFLMLMLRGRGLIAMAVVVALLALSAGVAAALAGGWTWTLLVPVLAAVGGASGVVMAGSGGEGVIGEGPRAPLLDDWRRLDSGQDPTIVATDDEPR